MSENPQPPQAHSMQPTPLALKQVTQRTVLRIIDRAKWSSLGLNDPSKTPEIGKYAQHNLQTLGLLLVDCWEAKYDLCALMTAAMEEIAEHATATLASELSAANAALAEAHEHHLRDEAMIVLRTDELRHMRTALATATAQLEAEVANLQKAITDRNEAESDCRTAESQLTATTAELGRAKERVAELEADQGPAETARQRCIAAKHLLEPIYGATNYAPIGSSIAKSLDYLDEAINALSHILSSAAAQPVATPAQGEGEERT